MRRVKSMLLTVLCMGLILGAGYFVIVESGQKVLEKERVLEESSYEDTSSNIFYGKIEENIELFPWSYYPEEGEERILGEYPRFLEAVLAWDAKDMEEELKAVQEWYLYQLIACESDTQPEEVGDWYRENQKGIMDSMVMVNTPQFGSIYFYQDILGFEEKQYQVRIACNEWSIISFTCMEYRNGQKQSRDVWEQGKQKLVSVLERAEGKMTEYFDYMMFLRYQSIEYLTDEGGYINAYLEGFYWLDGILSGKEYELSYVPKNVQILMEELGYGEESKMEANASSGKGEESAIEDPQPGYSYQIVELKDMILLLMQGEETLGVYYDPIAQRLCGYNFFYEY